MNKSKIVAVVDAPSISLDDKEPPGEALLKFYQALGWNGKDALDPCKIRTTAAVYDALYDVMYERCHDGLAVGAFMVNKAPGVDADVPPGKVRLLHGWIESELPDTPSDHEETAFALEESGFTIVSDRSPWDEETEGNA